jgi:hypothetical protein
MWHRCGYVTKPAANGEAVNNDAFIEHIKSRHIFEQKNSRKYRCQWRGCSVYNSPSRSFNWLERHVIDHIDKRPYTCIFNGCNRKYRTEAERERHVQLHISNQQQNAANAGASNASATLHKATSQSPSPVKTRQQKHNMLNSAKMALIQNIRLKSEMLKDESREQLKTSQSARDLVSLDKGGMNGHHACSTATLLAETKPNGCATKPKLENYSQFLKSLTKKRKAQLSNAEAYKRKFKKAQFKDYVDACSLKVIDHRLNKLNWRAGMLTFNANIVGQRTDSVTGAQTYLVEWTPKNM